MLFQSLIAPSHFLGPRIMTVARPESLDTWRTDGVTRDGINENSETFVSLKTPSRG
jgi:hypothetical protein